MTPYFSLAFLHDLKWKTKYLSCLLCLFTHLLSCKLQKKKALEQKTAPVNDGSKKVPTVKDDRRVKGNILDGSAPVLKRGKEREVPKHKKPSPLKKVLKTYRCLCEHQFVCMLKDFF